MRAILRLSALVLLASSCDYTADNRTTVQIFECNEGETRECGVGACAGGQQSCVGTHWAACMGPAPTAELCDGVDNDCDGDLDEDFGLGTECNTPEKCPGSIRCAEDGDAACELDGDRLAGEVCDGVDNDCDGWVDAQVVGSELISACQCQRRQLGFFDHEPGSKNLCPGDAGDPEDPCSTDGGIITVNGCVHCGTESYALCTTRVVDMSTFEAGTGDGSVLEVSFDVEATELLRGSVNLWFEGGPTPPHKPSPRKYFPLLSVGDAPGSFTKRFTSENACYPDWMTDEYGCSGNRGKVDCGGCSPNDTCGLPSAGCNGLDFTSPRPQVALEFCASGDPTFSATIVVREIALLSLGCVEGDQ